MAEWSSWGTLRWRLNENTRLIETGWRGYIQFCMMAWVNAGWQSYRGQRGSVCFNGQCCLMAKARFRVKAGTCRIRGT